MERLHRKDAYDHFANNLAKHMSLQAISFQQTVQSLKSENSALKKMIQELERKLSDQEINFQARFIQLQEEKLALKEQLEKQAFQINEQQHKTEVNLQQIEPLNQFKGALE